jgi:anti-sigma B factor antagonist
MVNGKQLVKLEGEINATTGAEYNKGIAAQFDKSKVIVISFRDVVYLNSSGLREIIDLLKHATKEKVELRLCDMSKDIREMFSFTGLEKVFKIYNTQSEAVG